METCKVSACNKAPEGLLVDWENKKLLPACKDHENNVISKLVQSEYMYGYSEGFMDGYSDGYYDGYYA